MEHYFYHYYMQKFFSKNKKYDIQKEYFALQYYK